MKNLVVLLLSICLIALGACNSPKEDGDSHNGDPQTSGGSRPAFTDLNQARILLTSQEQSLSRVHGYTFVYYGGLFQEIIAPSFISEDWLSKYDFYKDSLEYAANLILLKHYERQFIRENESLYREMVQKTRAMARMIFTPTYNFAISSMEELESFHYEFRPVLFVDFLDLKIHTYTYMPENHTHKTRDYNRTASDMCKMIDILNEFAVEDLNMEYPGSINSCDLYPKVKFVASFTGETPVRAAVENVTDSLLNYYDSLANQTLRNSGIRIDFNSHTGYDEEIRNNYEQSFINQNTDYPVSLIRQALENNLYENLYFKSRVISAQEYAYGSSNQLSNLKDLLNQSLGRLRHRVVDIRIGESPFNYDISLGSENFSRIPETASRLQQGSVERTPFPRVQQERPPALEQRPDGGSVDRSLPVPVPRSPEREEERPTPAPTPERAAPAAPEQRVEVEQPEREPVPPAPPQTTQRPEVEVEEEEAAAATGGGDSSDAPLNEGPAPIVVPEDIEDFFAD